DFRRAFHEVFPNATLPAADSNAVMRQVFTTFTQDFSSQKMRCEKAKEIARRLHLAGSREAAEKFYLRSDDLTRLQKQGIAIGSHTKSHCLLPYSQADEIEEELRASKTVLQDILGSPIHHFCYPSGLFNESSQRRVAQAGYRSATTVQS